MNYLQIKMGLSNLGIDINKFNNDQINEIGAALEQNIQPIFLIANPSKSADEMRAFISSRGGTPYKTAEEPVEQEVEDTTVEQEVEDTTVEQEVEETYTEPEEQVVEDTTEEQAAEESNTLDAILAEHQAEDQQTEEPITEEVVEEVSEEVLEPAEEPVIEESTIEEPVVEEPITEEPAEDVTEPYVEEVHTEEPVTEEIHDDSNTEESQESVLDSLLQSNLVEEPTPIEEVPDVVQESIMKELDINPDEEIPENHGYAGMVDIAAIIHAEMKSMGVSDKELFNKVFESIMYHNCVHYAISQYVREFIRNELEHVNYRR